MKIKCLTATPTLRGESVRVPGLDLGLTPGADYLVLGITLLTERTIWKDAIVYQVLSKHQQITHAPSSMFEIVDGRVSRYWTLKMEPSGAHIQPSAFHAKFFHDRLSDGQPEEVAAFREAVLLLDGEFGSAAGA